MDTSDARQAAIKRLWESACASVAVRHPDPTARVELIVRGGGWWHSGIEISFGMSDVHDTSSNNPHQKQPSGFRHVGRPAYWPGLNAAKVYISALWGLYLVHEAFELVTERNVKFIGGKKVETVACLDPIIDAHDEGGLNQTLLGSTSNFSMILGWAVGKNVADTLLSQEARETADLEVEKAMDTWEPGT